MIKAPCKEGLSSATCLFRRRRAAAQRIEQNGRVLGYARVVIHVESSNGVALLAVGPDESRPMVTAEQARFGPPDQQKSFLRVAGDGRCRMLGRNSKLR